MSDDTEAMIRWRKWQVAELAKMKEQLVKGRAVANQELYNAVVGNALTTGTSRLRSIRSSDIFDLDHSGNSTVPFRLRQVSWKVGFRTSGLYVLRKSLSHL